MRPDDRLLKTSTVKRLLARCHPMPAALRMLLITVDGHRSVQDLESLARSLGLAEGSVQACVDRGWLTPGRRSLHAGRRTGAAAPLSPLAPAHAFARDLAVRLLDDLEQELEDRWRVATDADSFDEWLTLCASAIRRAGGPEQARFFMSRVAQLRFGPDGPHVHGSGFGVATTRA